MSDTRELALADFPRALRTLPRRAYDTRNTHFATLPRAQVEAGEAARRATRAWRWALWRDAHPHADARDARGPSWREIDGAAFALVVLDKVLQLAEALRYGRTARPVPRAETIAEWRARMRRLTELVYELAADAAQPPCVPPALAVVRPTVLALADVFYVARADAPDPAPPASIDTGTLGRWHRPYRPRRTKGGDSSRANADSNKRKQAKTSRSKSDGGGRVHRVDDGLLRLGSMHLDDDDALDASVAQLTDLSLGGPMPPPTT